MPSRTFRLPGIQELTKEQERVLELPLEGQHLIVGGPGTGKSVMALLRARRAARSGRKYVFLVFNHLLNTANRELFRESLESRTWMSWFCHLYREATGSNEVPTAEPPAGRSFRPYDWDAILAGIKSVEAPAEPSRPLLIIDEGQDMPKQFYECLVEMGFEDFFVVADQNQRITDSNSSRQQLEEALAVEPEDVIELRRNFRNSRAIAKLAREFYTGDPASPPPELPPDTGPIPPVLYAYQDQKLPTVARRIILTSENQPSKLIGVISPTDAIRQKYHDALQTASQQIRTKTGPSYRPPAIRTFNKDLRPSDFRFAAGGILVINAQNCKGLEFDIVICVDLERTYIRREDLDATKKLFYVMAARARERLILLRQKGTPSHLELILPQDEAVLGRKEM